MMEKQTELQDRLYYGEATVLERAKYLVGQVAFGAPKYAKSLLPCLGWLPKYNRRWLMGDLVAGLTVGLMVVPQSLAYAKLANLPVVYGLYASFMGTIVYAFTGTCREIAVGPAAVLSLLVGSVASKLGEAHPDVPLTQIAVGINLIGGLVTLVLGVLQLGILLDLIPNPVIMGFTTGSAFVIISTQAASLLGVPNVASSGKTVDVLQAFFTNLPKLNYPDVIFGLSSLVLIMGLNKVAGKFGSRIPFLRALKITSNALSVVLFTGIAFAVRNTDFKLKLVRDVPQGFGGVGVPPLNGSLVKDILVEILPVILIGVLEHVSIAKAFARKSGYSVSSSQELVALGLGNVASSFMGGYPATGSFSRTAVNSQSGVRTPLGGVWVGGVVVLALWVLTPAFYYIPSATLSAIIISSAVSLISSPSSVMDLWRVQPLDCIVFLVASLTTFFGGAELGIGASIGLAFVCLLYQIARPQFFRLGRVSDRPEIFIDAAHPGYTTDSPLPGVILFRPQESLIFPNIDYIRDKVLDCVLEATTSTAQSDTSLWSDDLQLRGEKLRQDRARKLKTSPPISSTLPLLRAVVFDLGSVNLIDSSGLRGLFDIRDMLTRYVGDSSDSYFEISNTNPAPFELHFVSTHPKVLRVLELSKITSNSSNTLSPAIRDQLDKFSSDPTATCNYFTLEPIVFNPSRYVHLSIADALKRIQRNWDRQSTLP